MPFLFIGTALIIISVVLLRKANKRKDKEGAFGLNVLILAASILILFYGLFYSITIP